MARTPQEVRDWASGKSDAWLVEARVLLDARTGVPGVGAVISRLFDSHEEMERELLRLADLAEAQDRKLRSLYLALADAQDRFEAGEIAALGTINEHLQPVIDAAVAWARREQRERAEVQAAELERLRRVLAVERGVQAQAPEGWRFYRDDWVWKNARLGIAIDVSSPGRVTVAIPKEDWRVVRESRKPVLVVMEEEAAAAAMEARDD